MSRWPIFHDQSIHDSKEYSKLYLTVPLILMVPSSWNVFFRKDEYLKSGTCFLHETKKLCEKNLKLCVKRLNFPKLSYFSKL